ncbi:MAG: right-handed parallel beta-helix repeat-containing protein [Kiritimatiellae bacterium]|nr:right-handed parallel beta-helix repeat-containing protein [Kiritimatiellia bacterium]
MSRARLRAVAAFAFAFCAAPLFATGYTWTGRGDDALWTTPENWNDDQDGDAFGYPQSTADTATFPDLGGECYTVEVPCDITVGKMTFDSKFVTLKGVGGGRPKITPSNNTIFTSLALDNVEIYRNTDHTFGAGTYLHLKNGAYVTVNNFTMTAAGGTALLHLEGGSTFSSTQAYIGGGNKIVLDDSEYLLRNLAYLGHTSADCTIVFKGASPKLTVNGNFALQPNINTSNATLEFHIPEGGYASAPITTTTGNSRVFANTSTTGTITIDVVSAYGDGTGEYTCPLVAWTTGFNTAKTVLGSLPSSAAAASFALADETSGQSWADAAALTSAAKSIGVHIKGPSDALSWIDYNAPDGTWSAVADGAGNVVFTYVGNDNSRLRHWADAAGHPISPADTLTLPVAEAAGVEPVTCNVWHVAADGDDANGGTSPADAKATLAAGYALLSSAYDTLLVHDGTYTNVANFVVTNNWRIVGEHGAASTRIVVTNKFTSFTIGDGNKKSADNSGEVRGFTFAPANGDRQAHQVANVYYYGLLVDCVVTNIGTTSDDVAIRQKDVTSVISNCTFVGCQSSGAAGAVIQQWTNGLVLDCKFIDCAGSQDRYGGAITVGNSGSVVRNCLFVNCTNTGTAGAISFYGAGLVENCTIVGCKSTTSTTVGGGVGVFQTAGTLRNCIIYGCSNKAGSKALSGSVTVEYTAADQSIDGEGNILFATMPDFADPENGDYRVLSGATIDAGKYRSWMNGAGDLAGTSRVIGAAVDMGCYECVPQGLRAAIHPSDSVGLGDGSEITLTAIVSAADTNGLAYAWTVTDDAGATVFAASGADCASVAHAYGIGLYTVSLTVENAAGERFATVAEDIFAIKPRTVYLANGASQTYPYDTKATGFTSIVDAVAFAESGMTVIVADGVLTNTTADVTVSKAVEFRGEGGADSAAYYTTKNLTLDNAGSAIRNLTLCSNYSTEATISLTQGTLDSCVVTNYKRGNRLIGLGSGSVVTNCLVTGCWNSGRDCFIGVDSGTLVDSRVVGNKTTDGSYNELIRVSSGLVRNCLVAGNETKAGTANGTMYCGSAVSVTGAGTVESCTIVGNADTSASKLPAVGAKNSGAAIRNCIIAGNTNLDGPSGVGGSYGVARTTYTLSDVAGLTGTGCVTGDPRFKDAGRGDYRITRASPAVRAGLVLPWMAGAHDLNGNPRTSPNGRFVDMGCYQAALGEGFTIKIQ